MKNISYGSCLMRELPEKLSLVLSQEFGQNFKKEKTKSLILDRFKALREDLNVCIEYPYVDKLYRNTYYNYFSTKHEDYSRHCVRVSFFKPGYDVTKFDDSYNFQGSECLGYICLRPLFPAFFGRGLITSEAFVDSNFNSCSYEDDVMVMGKRFKLRGFPFSAQDGEYTTCAETCVWEVSEYFGQKYNEHRVVLPSDIIDSLSEFSHERQVPSKGLIFHEIAYALKQVGFGVRLYHKKAYEIPLNPYSVREFFRILYYYVNSGIPTVCSITNGKVNHAVVYIGYKDPIVDNDVTPAISHIIESSIFGKIEIVDYGDLIDWYVTIDDNRMSYQFSNFTLAAKPGEFRYHSYYNEKIVDREKRGKLEGAEKQALEMFKNLEINGLAVPLHPKMYLEATQARQYIFNILKQYPINRITFKPLYLRLFLTTGRSFKSWIAKETEIDPKVRELVIASNTPKFIWVGELSNHQLTTEQKAAGFVVIDATQTSVSTLDSLIFLYHPDSICYYENEKFAQRKGLEKESHFKIYKNY